MTRSAWRAQAHRVGAVGAVHRDAAAAGDEAHDLVARNRGAAARQPHHDVVETLDVHADVAVRRVPGARGGRATVTGSCSSPPRSSRWMRCTTALADTWSSPIADVERVEVGVVQLLGDLRHRRRRRQLLHRQPSRRSAFTSSSRPASIASTRRSRENHCRIFERARGVCTNCSQSRLGPAPSTLLVKISHVSPDCSAESSGTSRPLTRAPMQRWPTSVWIAYAKSTGVAPVGQRDDAALRREDEDLVLFEVDLQALHELAGSVVSCCQSTMRWNQTRSSVGLRCSL